MKFVNVSTYCTTHGVDYLAFINLMKKMNTNTIRIGQQYFVKDEQELDLIFQRYLERSIELKQKRQAKAKEVAETRRTATRLRVQMLEMGLTPGQIEEFAFNGPSPPTQESFIEFVNRNRRNPNASPNASPSASPNASNEANDANDANDNVNETGGKESC